jgi:hypothetical protein
MVLEGLSGVLVTDPHTDLPDRYVGQIRKPLEERKAATCRADRYTTCTVAVPFHHHLLKAVKRGTIRQIGEYVYADSASEALTKSAPKPTRSKPKPQTPIKETPKEKGNK